MVRYMDITKNKTAISIVTVLLVGGWIGSNYFRLSELDIYKISTRRGYYPKVVSRLFQNKLTESLYISRNRLLSLLSTDHIFRLFGYE